MPRLAALAVAIAAAGAASPARADPASAGPSASDQLGHQGVGAELGVAIGGRVTPGGLRIAGNYLYQLSSHDWFDGVAAFTFGGGSAACFRDRMNNYICDHGLADGYGVEIGGVVRRYFAARGEFMPFAKLGLGIGLARFSADGVSGLAIPVHLGGGIRAQVAPSVAVVAEAQVDVGFGAFNHGLGLQPQLGASIVAGAEFPL